MRLVAIDWPKGRSHLSNRQGAYIAVDVLETKAMQPEHGGGECFGDRKVTDRPGQAIYGIYFDTGKADIKPESRPRSTRLLPFLEDRAWRQAACVGHRQRGWVR